MLDYEIKDLIDHAHDFGRHVTIISAAKGATPNEGGLLLNGLLSRAEREPKLQPLLYLLAATYLKQMKHVPKGIEKNVRKHVLKVLPPRTVTQARALICAGNLAIPFLEPLLSDYKHSHQTRSLCIRALAMIGGDAALQVIETYAKNVGNTEVDTRYYINRELIHAQEFFDYQEYEKRVLEPMMRTSTVLNLSKDLSLEKLPSLPALHTASLDMRGRKLEDLVQLLVTSPNLKKLELSNAGKLKKIDCLQMFVGLQELKVDDCRQLTDLKVLSRLPDLKRLSLAHLKQEHARDLQAVNALEQLELENCSDIEDLGCIKHLTDLQDLKVRSCPTLKDISALASLTNLRKFALSYCDNLGQADGLEGLSQLETLELKGCDALKDVRALRSLTNLRKLDLSYCKDLGQLDGLQGLISLETLDLSGCDVRRDLSLLSFLTNLQMLTMTGCKSLEELDGLEGLSHLEWLNLHWCEALKDVRALSSLTNLQTLNLSYCSGLEQLDGLEGLSHLESLSLYACYALKDMSALDSLTNLQNLTQVEG